MAVADEMSFHLDSPQVDLNCDRVVFTVSDAGEITSTTAPGGYAVTKTGTGQYTLNVPSNPDSCLVICTSNVAMDELFNVDYQNERTGVIVLTSRSGADPSEITTFSCLIFVSRSVSV